MDFEDEERFLMDQIAQSGGNIEPAQLTMINYPRTTWKLTLRRKKMLKRISFKNITTLLHITR